MTRVPPMRVTDLGDGLRRWTGWHEEWKQEVGSVSLESPDGLLLFDPLVPPGDEKPFLASFDRDIARAGGRVHVLITVFWHARHARELLGRHGGRLWAPARGRAPVARRAGEVTDVFRPGDPLPGGVVALASARANEVVYHLPGPRALVAGDVILGAPGGGLRLCPESWLPTGTGHERLRESLRPLLELDVERVLVSHGEPVLTGGGEALRALLA